MRAFCFLGVALVRVALACGAGWFCFAKPEFRSGECLRRCFARRCAPGVPWGRLACARTGRGLAPASRGSTATAPSARCGLRIGAQTGPLRACRDGLRRSSLALHIQAGRQPWMRGREASALVVSDHLVRSATTAPQARHSTLHHPRDGLVATPAERGARSRKEKRPAAARNERTTVGLGATRQARSDLPAHRHRGDRRRRRMQRRTEAAHVVIREAVGQAVDGVVVPELRVRVGGRRVERAGRRP